MKNIFAALLVLSFIIPGSTHAQTISSNALLIESLSAQIKVLQEKLAALQSTTASLSAFDKKGKLDFKAYKKTTTPNIIKDPNTYLDKRVSVSSLTITKFIPAADPNTSKNYLETSAGINLKISLDSDYTKITKKVNVGDSLMVLGLGAKAERFRVNGENVTKPVIEVDGLVFCSFISSSNTYRCNTKIEDNILFAKKK